MDAEVDIEIWHSNGEGIVRLELGSVGDVDNHCITLRAVTGDEFYAEDEP